MPKMLRVALLAGCVLGIAVAALNSCSNNTKSSYVTNPPGNTTPGELNGSLPSTGSQYRHAFATAGTFNYKCTIHPSCVSLMGTIVVVAAGVAIQNRVLGLSQDGGSSGPYGSTCSSLSLQRDTVQVGDTLTWTNNTAFPHTVTSY